MPNLRVNTIKSQDGTKGPTFDGDLEFFGESHIVLPKGTTAQRPTGVAAGSLRFNTDTKLVEQYNGTDWVTLNSYGVGRGVFAGGGSTPTSPFSGVKTIDYITIATTGNALSFGNLANPLRHVAGASSSTRGCFAGESESAGTENIIEYITIATTGNATDFGDLTVSRYGVRSCSSSTRGVFGGGGNPARNIIDYITIATTGNATDFGDLTVARTENASCSSNTRGVFGGGYIYTPTISFFNVIDYITIATTGNATDFGDLTQSRGGFGSCSSSTRGVFGGGGNDVSPAFNLNTMDYVTIATTGNAASFGDLTVARSYLPACSSSTRGVFGGGATPTIVNTIDFITIASNGTNAQDFGDLTQARNVIGALSDAHGGLS